MPQPPDPRADTTLALAEPESEPQSQSQSQPCPLPDPSHHHRGDHLPCRHCHAWYRLHRPWYAPRTPGRWVRAQ